MAGEITIPIWLFVLFMLLSIWASLESILIPSTRWLLRRRINRVIDEIGIRPDIEIRPFQLIQRQVLIDRLIYDPMFIEAIERQAQELDIPCEVLQAEVHGYVQGIGPSFNAYLYFRIGYWMAKKKLHGRCTMCAWDSSIMKNLRT